MKRLTILFIALFLINGAVFSQKIAVGQVKTVVIDPGHGGAKPGALGRKYKEKDITLSIALKLGK
ncbi:MAG: N-acetylmuramoyl-L-alanine amidase, partial [Bacteroidales bacterium]|nr:N-acetylmuramoyl-L-alanine amidase [Bacteroidales bacterium]